MKMSSPLSSNTFVKVESVFVLLLDAYARGSENWGNVVEIMKTQAIFPLVYNYREKFRDIKRNASANLLLGFYLTE